MAHLSFLHINKKSQVAQIQEKITDFRRRNFQCLVSEDNVEVLKAMEEFQVKIIKFEHMSTSFLLI